jgi:hypothetical protein
VRERNNFRLILSILNVFTLQNITDWLSGIDALRCKVCWIPLLICASRRNFGSKPSSHSPHSRINLHRAWNNFRLDSTLNAWWDPSLISLHLVYLRCGKRLTAFSTRAWIREYQLRLVITNFNFSPSWRIPMILILHWNKLRWMRQWRQWGKNGHTAAKTLDVSGTTLYERLRGRPPRHKAYEKQHLLSQAEERELLWWITRSTSCDYPRPFHTPYPRLFMVCETADHLRKRRVRGINDQYHQPVELPPVGQIRSKRFTKRDLQLQIIAPWVIKTARVKEPTVDALKEWFDIMRRAIESHKKLYNIRMRVVSWLQT